VWCVLQVVCWPAVVLWASHFNKAPVGLQQANEAALLAFCNDGLG
jgi:hypothetical protein